jgi:hypothetical protein
VREAWREWIDQTPPWLALKFDDSLKEVPRLTRPRWIRVGQYL